MTTANFLLLLFLTGIFVPRCCGMTHGRRFFGWENIPFDFRMRRQLDAYFDVFGGEVGRDLLVKEEDLNIDLGSTLRKGAFD